MGLECPYYCIELNAHALIASIIKLRGNEEHNLFLPWLMSSQPCEAKFREVRSKEVSFSILEMQSSLRRIDTLASSSLQLEGKIVFPRHHKAILKSNAESHVPVSLPEDFEIEQAVSMALSEAFNLVEKVGLVAKKSSSFIPPSGLVPINPAEMDLEENEEYEDNEDPAEVEPEYDVENENEEFINELRDVEEDLFMVSSGSLGLKTFTDITITETCPYVIVTDCTNEPTIVKKSSLCWLLRSGNTKISSDRLLRVQESSLVKNSLCSKEIQKPSKEPVISVADWCAFRSEDGSFVVGRVLAFRYMSGTTRKNQVYSRLDAPTEAPETNARGLGCLCSWFKIQKNLLLSPMSMELHCYYNIENYLCSLPRPKVVRKSSLKLTCSLQAIKQFLFVI